MAEKIVGVLGGMGPEATVDFFAKVIALTAAKRDQDHLRIIIDNNPAGYLMDINQRMRT